MLKNQFKKDFSIFKANKKLVYLDSGSTAQTPDVVVAKMDEYYKKYNANIHRGLYGIAQKADAEYEKAREIVADFINAETSETIFTSGTTHGLNLLAYSLSKNLKKGDNVVLTRMEHHANLVPWQEMSRIYGFEIKFIELTNDYRLDLKSAARVINKKTKIVSMIHASNTLGTINPAEKIIKLAKKVGAYTILDSAQYIPHYQVDVKKLGCDFLVFSGHKICGPTGIGVLYGKKEHLDVMEPFMFGGDMVAEVSYDKATWNKLPIKFEAGTPNIAGAIGLGAAIEYLKKIGYARIQNNELRIKNKFAKELVKLKKVKIVGPKADASDRLAIFSFVIGGVHPHDVAEVLAESDIAIRPGHHCAMPLMRLLGVKSTSRASFYFYNDEADVDKLIDGIKKVLKVFKVN